MSSSSIPSTIQPADTSDSYATTTTTPSAASSSSFQSGYPNPPYYYKEYVFPCPSSSPSPPTTTTTIAATASDTAVTDDVYDKPYIDMFNTRIHLTHAIPPLDSETMLYNDQKELRDEFFLLYRIYVREVVNIFDVIYASKPNAVSCLKTIVKINENMAHILSRLRRNQAADYLIERLTNSLDEKKKAIQHIQTVLAQCEGLIREAIASATITNTTTNTKRISTATTNTVDNYKNDNRSAENAEKATTSDTITCTTNTMEIDRPC